MKIKQIASIAIIAALPFGVWADEPHIGPNNIDFHEAYYATDLPPYETLTPTDADQTHIATTAYVKGAYNDAIMAINKSVEDIQENMSSLLYSEVNGEGFDISHDVQQSLQHAGRDRLVSSLGVKNAIDAVDTKLDSKRVRIYTTWDDDTVAATTLVPFEMVQ